MGDGAVSPSPDTKLNIGIGQTNQISDDMVNYLVRILGRRRDEALVGIFFCQELKFLDVQVLAFGDSHRVTISTRRLLRTAIHSGAAALLLAHNHPSGNLEPSDFDRQSTYDAKTICSIIGIDLLDHFIVCDDRIYSIFQSKQLIEYSEW